MKIKFKTIALLFLVVLGYQSSTQAQENKFFTNGLPIEVPEGFIWGISGHTTSTDSPPYRNNIPLQVELLKEHQFDYYRLGVPTTLNGVAKRKQNLDKILGMLKGTDIKILPILGGKEFLNFDGPAKDYYSIGYKQTKGFLRVYKDYFDYYVLFNEVNRKIKNKSKFKNGISSNEYDNNKFSRFADYIRGMITAIREMDPSAKIIINSTGYLSVGFLHLLKEAHIDYDIIGYHWYSGMKEFGKSRKQLNNKSVYQYLADNFSQDIWVTEINRKDGSGLRKDGLSKEEEEVQQRKMVMDYINELDNQHIIKAFFIYELLDEPHLDDNKGYENPKEAYYGIMDWDEKQKKYTYKKASKALKFKIEETKYGYEDYIYSLFSDLANGNPNPKDKNFISLKNKFEKTKKKNSIVKEFLRTQPNQKSTDKQYESLLKKISKNYDVSIWKTKKRTKEETIKDILLSNEYWIQSIIDNYKRKVGNKFYH